MLVISSYGKTQCDSDLRGSVILADNDPQAIVEGELVGGVGRSVISVFIR